MLYAADPLPAKCFICHAYADAAVRDHLIKLLPTGVTPFVFPSITVWPQEFVSDPLTVAVLGCDGLIYLRGGASDRSFLVAVERDCALRSSKNILHSTPPTLICPETRALRSIWPHSRRIAAKMSSEFDRLPTT